MSRALWRRSSGVVALSGLVVLGATATVLAFGVERANDRRLEAQTLDQAAERLSLDLRSSLSALRGMSALAVDGSVDAAEFAAFGAEVRRASAFVGLAYGDIIDGGDRAAWEARTGYGIRDTDGAGGFTAAAIRDRYVPVRLVDPANDTTRSVLGFDVTSDPVRRDGERQAFVSVDPVIVGPIRLATSGRPGLYVILAVRDPGGRPIGAVSSGLTASTLIENLADIPGIATDRVTLLVDGEVVVDGHQSGERRVFDAGGREITLIARDQRGTPFAVLPFVVLGATIALAAAAGLFADRDRRDRTAAREEAERRVRLAALADDLATATDPRSVVRVAAARAGAVLGADHTNVGVVDPTDPGKLVVVHDPTMDGGLGELFAVQAIDARLPLTDCVRTVRPVVVASRDAYAEAYPAVLGEVDRAGIQAVVCAPLQGSLADGAIGVVGFAWRWLLRSREVVSVGRAVAEVAEVLGRALERALGREAVELGMQRLREFTADLASAKTLVDVQDTVSEQLPVLFGVRAVTVESVAPGGAPVAGRHFPVYDDPAVSVVLAVHADDGAWTPAHDDLMATVAGLVQHAWRRARQHEQERGVLLRLQATLLTPAPPPRHVALDVRYVAALDMVGLGGDWYSIVERPDATFLVIGDIAGHGPEAVAVMAEVKSLLRHVLDRGATMEHAIEEADACLRRRGTYASATLVEIPLHEPVLHYLNAGHPYPMVRTPTGVELLTDSHRPWLGFPAQSRPPSTRPFEPGELLLLYTDGLVERRDRSIDDGIDAVARTLATTPPEELFDTLLAGRTLRLDTGYVDDDVALVSALRLPDRPTR